MISLEAQNKLIDIMESIIKADLSHGGQVKVRDILLKHKISYEEYRLAANLCLPAMRLTSEIKRIKYQYALLRNLCKAKGITEDELAKIEKEDEE